MTDADTEAGRGEETGGFIEAGLARGWVGAVQWAAREAPDGSELEADLHRLIKRLQIISHGPRLRQSDPGVEPVAWVLEVRKAVGGGPHKLACDEMHAHKPPRCCSPGCWCQQENVNRGWIPSRVTSDVSDVERWEKGSPDHRAVPLYRGAAPTDEAPEGNEMTLREAIKYLALTVADTGRPARALDVIGREVRAMRRLRSTPQGGTDTDET